MLGLIALNQVLFKSLEAIQGARQKKAWGQHLKQGSATQPQPRNACYPLNNPYNIECPCIDASLLAWLRPSIGANLILVSPSLIETRAHQTYKFLVRDKMLDLWVLWFGYHVKKISDIILCILEENCLSLIEYTKYSHFHPEAIRTVILTTKRSYQSQVLDLFKGAFFIGWGRVCIDEAHVNINIESEILKLAHGIGKEFWRWMITEISFESMSSQIAIWIATLEQS